MATLTEQLAALQLARASGLRATQHGDTRTEYKSDSEMAAAIADLERRIAAGNPVKTIYINNTRGI
jgi:hypothetical protein